MIAQEAALFIAREAGHESLITVIRAQPYAQGTRVCVFVSVFPKEKQVSALSFLSRMRENFSEHLKSHTRIRPLPRIDFALAEASGGDEKSLV